jgi:hypothetical protein
MIYCDPTNHRLNFIPYRTMNAILGQIQKSQTLQIYIILGIAAVLSIVYFFVSGRADGFMNYTGLKTRVDRPMTDNNTEAKGSQQNSPGINATGMADSAANPLRDDAPPTMATPYTTQPESN